jgi:predicted AlkP superfamily phosphohydrolase/phosphomutase/Flp pilus assembly protein TadD
MRRFLRAGLVLAVAAMASVALISSCRRGDAPGRVIVFGLDGADPATIDLLLSEGKLPHFAKLRREGAYAPLQSQKPLLSPVIWTTITTGKTPDAHRIGHFVAVNAAGEQLPVTSRMRRVKALWNILTDKQRSSAVVGWWATWPAETIRGSVVTDHFAYHFLMEDSAQKAEPGGRTFPPELEKRIAPDARRPQDVTKAELAPFVTVTDEEFAKPFDFESDLSHFKWAYATAGTYTRIGLRLWKEDRPDNLFVYIEGLDSTSHLFGHLFRAGNLSGELAEQQRKYGHAVEQMYAYADQLVGSVMDAMDARTTLLVLSDHGFELGRLQDDPSKTRDMRRVSELFHRPEGILYMYGYRVKPRIRLQRPTILDVAPTILALNGLPRASDMPGRVLAEALDVTVLPLVPTYETSSTVAAAASGTGDAEADPEIVKKLTSLGYIGAKSPTGDRNLAGVHFEEGRYEDAAREYAALVQQSPDDSALRASYAGALGALGRYDAALEQLDKAIALEPVNVEAYHNRAVIHERRGERDAAIRDYQTAVRYSPSYEPSRRALARLGAALPQAPRSDAEKKAAALAEDAAGAARRGDYAEAGRKLDEAERIAPRFALVYQYRANVAYLRGDRAAAIAALEKGLKLEPDNALFRENLKRLEQPPAPKP